jgi:hypothetical protein
MKLNEQVTGTFNLESRRSGLLEQETLIILEVSITDILGIEIKRMRVI